MNKEAIDITIKNAKYLLISCDYTDKEKLDLFATIIEKLESDL